MTNLSTLAGQMGVAEADIRSFAEAIVLDMKKDSVDDAAKAMTEEERIEIVQAYSMAAVRKMQAFTNAYFANPRAAETFRRTVLNLL